MTKISKSYMLSHDLDWFFRCGNIIVHCASNGSEVPYKANDNSNVHYCQEIIVSASDLDYDIITDEYYEQKYVDPNIDRLIESLGHEAAYQREELKEIYYSSFKVMAHKGIWSFDYSHKENKYLLVARPVGNINLNRLLTQCHPTQQKYLSDLLPNFDFLHIDETTTSLNFNEII